MIYRRRKLNRNKCDICGKIIYIVITNDSGKVRLCEGCFDSFDDFSNKTIIDAKKLKKLK